jgi:hypothetical protein
MWRPCGVLGESAVSCTPKVQGLLPELCQRLASEDPAVVNGVLHTANSIFKRWGSLCWLAGTHP